jgi:hypothetical protein
MPLPAGTFAADLLHHLIFSVSANLISLFLLWRTLRPPWLCLLWRTLLPPWLCLLWRTLLPPWRGLLAGTTHSAAATPARLLPFSRLHRGLKVCQHTGSSPRLKQPLLQYTIYQPPKPNGEPLEQQPQADG